MVSTWMFGALCAVIAALILGVSAGRGGPLWLLEVVTIVFFISVTIAGMIVGRRIATGWTRTPPPFRRVRWP